MVGNIDNAYKPQIIDIYVRHHYTQLYIIKIKWLLYRRISHVGISLVRTTNINILTRFAKIATHFEMDCQIFLTKVTKGFCKSYSLYILDSSKHFLS